MDSIKVKTNLSLYPIYFHNSFDTISNALSIQRLNGRKLCIVTDDIVGSLYIDNFISNLCNDFDNISVHTFTSGEANKNLSSIEKMYDTFMANKLDRRSVIIALGGGVTGDMAGFAAATYLRGITFIQVPTTLLSQVDSSVGGKVGVDFKKNKNIIGSFYQPTIVYINIETLKTLPKREFACGMAEVIKYGLILDSDFYHFIDEQYERINNLNPTQLFRVIQRSCMIKSEIVSKDEMESGLRAILNFGHTIGHAIESLLDFKLLHGECIALGMKAALYISYTRKNINSKELDDFDNMLQKYNLLNVLEDDVDNEAIYNQMFLDKKVRDNKIEMILLSKIGSCYRTTDVTSDEVFDALNILRK